MGYVGHCCTIHLPSDRIERSGIIEHDSRQSFVRVTSLVPIHRRRNIHIFPRLFARTFSPTAWRRQPFNRLFDRSWCQQFIHTISTQIDILKMIVQSEYILFFVLQAALSGQSVLLFSPLYKSWIRQVEALPTTWWSIGRNLGSSQSILLRFYRINKLV